MGNQFTKSNGEACDLSLEEVEEFRMLTSRMFVPLHEK